MSWLDYEYGPADTDVDYLIDDGWMPPDEAEDLQKDRDHFERVNFGLFVVILFLVVGVFI